MCTELAYLQAFVSVKYVTCDLKVHYFGMMLVRIDP